MKRTHFDVVKDIFKALFVADEPQTISYLRERTGLHNTSVNNWMNLIAYIQNQPPLIIQRTARTQRFSLEKEVVPPSETDPHAQQQGFALLQQLIEMPDWEVQKRIKLLKLAARAAPQL